MLLISKHQEYPAPTKHLAGISTRVLDLSNISLSFGVTKPVFCSGHYRAISLALNIPALLWNVVAILCVRLNINHALLLKTFFKKDIPVWGKTPERSEM